MVTPLKDKDNLVLNFIKQNPLVSSKEIHEGLAEELSYATVKRIIQVLISEKLVVAVGKNKATKYEISLAYNLLYPIDAANYFLKELDDRDAKTVFNFSLIEETLSNTSLFTVKELSLLSTLQREYEFKSAQLSENQYKKEQERLAIDLSWKSSQIEGNTYSLLETELLLKEHEMAVGKSKDEATMLLNHKEALDFIIANPNYIVPLSVSTIEDIHSILVKSLAIDRNIRKQRVGISGTNYKPLDNEFQIKEALSQMCVLVNKQNNVFAEALLVLILISYIQAFSDGNKRTARILSNAILIKNNYCPISFRTVNAIDYKKAMLIFYEQNNISVFKEIFIAQFEFAVKTYF